MTKRKRTGMSINGAIDNLDVHPEQIKIDH